MAEGDRRADGETRSRIDLIVADLETATKNLGEQAEALERGRQANQNEIHRARTAIKWMARGMVILAVGNTVALVVTLRQGDDVAAQSNRIAEQSNRLAGQAKEIQQQRRVAVRDSCEGQNKRHDDTIRALDGALDAAKIQYPERAARLAESRAFTVLLIEALQPHQNCEALVRERVK